MTSDLENLFSSARLGAECLCLVSFRSIH